MTKSESEIIDLERAVRISSEIARTGKALRFSYLESRKEELLAIFENYKKTERKIRKPNPDAITIGFRKAWKNRDYESIVKVGDLIEKKLFEFYREEEALYMLARKLVQEKNDK